MSILSIPVKAVGKERPRYSAWNKCMYTPKKTKDFEALVGAYGAIYMKDNGMRITDGPISISVTVFDKVPKSWSKAKRESALGGDIRPMKTPDGDNIIKALFDGLQGVLFIDDKQVVQFYFNRLYDEDHRIDLGFKYL